MDGFILIIDIIGESYNECNTRQWKKILIKHDVPLDFFKIAKYFKSPFFTSNPNFKKFNYNIDDIRSFEKLLWKWNSKLSTEWYPFLFGVKHDLELYLDILSNERLIKTQTHPFVNNILKIGRMN